MRRLVLALILPACMTACSKNTHSSDIMTEPSTVTAASPSQKSALLDRIKSLAGTWESPDDLGNMHTSSVYSVTSNGSVVRQIMMPGTDHEMTNMYHMDGPTLVMVHYCAMGNQPHMRATAANSTTDRIELKSDGVTNWTSPNQLYMGELTIIFKDADHVREEWVSIEKGKSTQHATFDLTRKK